MASEQPDSANPHPGPVPEAFEAVGPQDRFVQPDDASETLDLGRRRLPLRETYLSLDPATEIPSHAADVTLVDSIAGAEPPSAAADRSPIRTPDFMMQRLIAQGGQAEVWLAIQASLDREVAVKLLRPSRSARATADFLHEAYTTASLDHPNIVPVYELSHTRIGDREGHLLAMKLIRGAPWDAAMHEDRRSPDFSLPEHLARHLPTLLAVCNALAYAHSKNIIHRDLKPRQVVVGDFGEVHLLDWGLALSLDKKPPKLRSGDDIPKFRTRDTATNPSGTPAYMAPEQTIGSTVDLGFHTDIYLLGATLFEVAAGRPPHDAPSGTEAYAMALRNICLPLPADCPEEVARIVRRALDSDPAKRHASVQEFKADIEDYLTGSGRRRESAALVETARARIAAKGAHAGYDDFVAAERAVARALMLWPHNEDARAFNDELLSRHAELALESHDYSLARTLAAGLDDEARLKLAARADAEDEQRKRLLRQRHGLLAFSIVLLAVIVVATAAISSQMMRRLRTDSERLLANAALARVQGERRLAEERAEAEARTSALLQRVNSLREEEGELARALESEAPLPDILLPDEGVRTVREPAGAERLLERRRELARERERLAADPVAAAFLGREPYALLLAEANLALANARSREDLMSAYSAYAEAAKRRADLPQPQAGMGAAAARIGDATSATLHLERAAAITLEASGERSTAFAQALVMLGDAHRMLGDRTEDYVQYYRRSFEILAPQWLDTTLDMSRRWQRLGEYAKAERFLVPAVDFAEEHWGEDSKTAMKAAAELAQNQQSLAKYDEAQTMIDALLATALKQSGSDSAEVSDARHSLGILLGERGDFAGAERELRESLRIAEARYGPEDTETAAIMLNLGRALDLSGRPQEAGDLAQRAIDILSDKLGPQHPRTARALNHLALTQRHLGEYPEAEKTYRRALDITRRTLGERHPETVSILNNLATLMRAMGRNREGLDLLRTALDINRSLHGEEHPDTATSYSNLATALRALGDAAQAEAYARRALEIFTRFHGEKHPATAQVTFNYGAILEEMGRADEAMPYFLRGLALIRGAYGDDHPLLSTTLNSFATALTNRGMYAEAETILREVLQKKEAANGIEHPDTAMTYYALGTNLSMQSRFAEAVGYLRRAQEVSAAKLSPTHARTVAAVGNLAIALAQVGEAEEAEGMLAGLWAKLAAEGADAAPRRADALYFLASVQNLRGRRSAAATFALAAFQAQAAAPGMDRGNRLRRTASIAIEAMDGLPREPRRDRAIVALSAAAGQSERTRASATCRGWLDARSKRFAATYGALVRLGEGEAADRFVVAAAQGAAAAGFSPADPEWSELLGLFGRDVPAAGSADWEEAVVGFGLDPAAIEPGGSELKAAADRELEALMGYWEGRLP